MKIRVFGHTIIEPKLRINTRQKKINDIQIFLDAIGTYLDYDISMRRGNLWVTIKLRNEE